MKILALDLGKSKSAACQYSAATGEHRFETITTRPQALYDLLEADRPDRVVIEICSAALQEWQADRRLCRTDASIVRVGVDEPPRQDQRPGSQAFTVHAGGGVLAGASA